MTAEDLEQVKKNPEFQPFAEFHDKLERKMKIQDSNHKMLERLKESMGKIHHELDELKKKQSEKPRASRSKMGKTGAIPVKKR